MSGPNRLSVAIPSWNGRRHLEVCLGALAGQVDPGRPWEVLVYDNGSSDGTERWLARHHPAVRVIAVPTNQGFAAACNRLVEAATGDVVVLLNNDTRPEPEWLAAFVEAWDAAAGDVAAISGRIVDWEAERLDFAEGVMTFDAHAFQLGFRRPLGAAEEPAEGAELFFGCGGNLAVRRDVYLALGGLDEAYFAYYEDVDLGWRLWAAGYRVVYAPRATVRHRSSATSDLLGLFHRGFLFERNAYVTAAKNFDDELWGRMMPAVDLTLLARTRALLVANNPGGETFDLDPYQGLVGDTGGRPPAAWWRRGLRRIRSRLLRTPRRGTGVAIEDERTIAQLRVLSSLVGSLGSTMDRRRRVQETRRRSDREIFERFPLFVVPTYPGDEALFADPGFAALLPADVPMIRRRLDEVMELGP